MPQACPIGTGCEIGAGQSMNDCHCIDIIPSNQHCDQGFYWEGTICAQCPENHYCPYTNGRAICCPEQFPYSGAQSSVISQCEAQVTCGDTTSYVGCNWNNNTCDFEDSGTSSGNTVQYTVQGQYDNGLNYPQTKEKISYQNQNLLYGNIPDDYHLELIPHYSDPGHEQNQSWSPSSYTIACVPNTKSCADFQHTATPYPNGDYDEISASIETTHCPIGATIEGNATWDSDNTVWDISQCSCNLGNNNLVAIEEANCWATGTQAASTTNQIDAVHSIQENVIFQETIHATSGCRKCFADTDSNHYYVADNAFNNGVVNECTTVNQHIHGYYRHPLHSDYCGGETLWSENIEYSESNNPCAKVKCPKPGQTTLAELPIGVNNCTYKPYTNGDPKFTKFCDSKGCFVINASDFSDWTFEP